MPELPAVEFSKRLIEDHLKGQQIRTASFFADAIVFGGVPEVNIQKALEGRRLVKVGRYGKYFWLVLHQEETNQLAYLLIHLGMTGFVQVRGIDRLIYRSAPETVESLEKAEEWPPRFCKMILNTKEKNTFLAFGDVRRLARVRLLYNDPLSCAPVQDLGFDPLLDMPPYDANFIARIHRRSVPLKTLLLDQTFAAGVGNWMADDIMLAAHIHPEARSNTLTENQIQQLHDAIRYITVTAVNCNSDGAKFPSSWLFHQRWPKDRKSSSGLIEGHRIQYVTIGGRTTAFVPDLQKKTGSSMPSTLMADLKTTQPSSGKPSKRATTRRGRPS